MRELTSAVQQYRMLMRGDPLFEDQLPKVLDGRASFTIPKRHPYAPNEALNIDSYIKSNDDLTTRGFSFYKPDGATQELYMFGNYGYVVTRTEDELEFICKHIDEKWGEPLKYRRPKALPVSDHKNDNPSNED